MLRRASLAQHYRVVLAVLVLTAWMPVIDPVAGAEEPEEEAQSPVTQEMNGFAMSGYRPDGTKRWDLTGTGARIEGPIVTISRPDGIGYNVSRPDDAQPAAGEEAGPRTAYLTASLAQIEQQTRRIRLEHDVTVHTSDGVWLSSPLLYWLPDREEVVTDQPVRIETDQMLLRGREAVAQVQLKEATLQRDVELVLHPDRSASSASVWPSGKPAQSSARGADGSSRDHVIITCDGPLHFDYQRYIATFHDNVHIQDREGELYSDTLVAYLNRTTRGIRYAEAIGHVQVEQDGRVARSQKAVYEPGRGLITLLGEPWVTMDKGGEPAGPAPKPLDGGRPVPARPSVIY